MKKRKLKMKSTDTAWSLYQECQALFPCWCWNEEELKTVTNDRQGDYEIEFNDTVEADEDLKNMSADNLKEKGIVGITLPERIKFELDYFKKTGKHLNIQSWTLCSGSRCSDGDVPGVGWSDCKMRVSWHSPDGAYGNLRSRQAVSKPCNLNLEYSDTSILGRLDTLEKFKSEVEKILRINNRKE